MKTWTAVLALHCATTPVAAWSAEPTLADIGPEPAQPLAAIRQLMSTQLREPASAEYRIMGIHPARCKAGWATKDKDWTGYAAKVEINAKNGFGGFTGFTSHTILFVGNAAVRIVDGENFGAFGPSKGLLGLGGGAGICRFLDH